MRPGAAGRPRRPDGRRAALALAAGTLALAVATHAARQTTPPPAAAQTAPAGTTTVKDKVYTTEQADRGEKSFQQGCPKCHLFDGPVTKDGPPLGGDVFFNKWEGKSVFEMGVEIRLNMPPDGSIVIDPDEAADLIAFILRKNGFPPGDKPLTVDPSSKTLLFVRNK